MCLMFGNFLKGGYFLQAKLNESSYELARANRSLNLVKSAVEKVLLTVTHGLIDGTSSRLTRITVLHLFSYYLKVVYFSILASLFIKV